MWYLNLSQICMQRHPHSQGYKTIVANASQNQTVFCHVIIPLLIENGYIVRYIKNAGYYKVTKADAPDRSLNLYACSEKLTEDQEVNKLDTNVERIERINSFLAYDKKIYNNATGKIENVASTVSEMHKIQMPETVKRIDFPTCGEIRKTLETLGFQSKRQAGSHVTFKDNYSGRSCTLSCATDNVQKNSSVINETCMQCKIDRELFRWAFAFANKKLDKKYEQYVIRMIQNRTSTQPSKSYFNLSNYDAS